MKIKDEPVAAAWRAIGASADPPAATAAGPFPERLGGLSILVVDDISANVDALRELLKLEGARVAIAVGGERALELVAHERFDVVICDVAMPAMSGTDVVAAMRASGPNARTPAIAYTGYGGLEERRKASEAGFDRHLTKPASLDTFVGAILDLAGPR